MGATRVAGGGSPQTRPRPSPGAVGGRAAGGVVDQTGVAGADDQPVDAGLAAPPVTPPVGVTGGPAGGTTAEGGRKGAYGGSGAAIVGGGMAGDGAIVGGGAWNGPDGA